MLTARRANLEADDWVINGAGRLGIHSVLVEIISAQCCDLCRLIVYLINSNNSNTRNTVLLMLLLPLLSLTVIIIIIIILLLFFNAKWCKIPKG